MEPPNKGHFGSSHVNILCREVVLFLEILVLWECYTLKSVLYREVVPFSEGPLSEVPLYISSTVKERATIIDASYRYVVVLNNSAISSVSKMNSLSNQDFYI